MKGIDIVYSYCFLLLDSIPWNRTPGLTWWKKRQCLRRAVPGLCFAMQTCRGEMGGRCGERTETIIWKDR
jgi:hypothetical protein